MPKPSQESNKARNTPASSGGMDKLNSYPDTQLKGRQGAVSVSNADVGQANPEWISKGNMRRNAWRAALTATVALMALIVTTAIGTSRLISSPEAAPSVSSVLSTSTTTRVVQAATATQSVRYTPTNAALLAAQPSATGARTAAPTVMPTLTGTVTPTQALSTATLTVAVQTATATSSATITAIPTAAATATAVPTSTAAAIVTATTTFTAIPTARPTRIAPKPTPTRFIAPTRAIPPTRTPPRPTLTRVRAQTTPTPARTQTYTVQPGDTLLVIAARFGVSLKVLADANGLDVGAAVYPGQVLIIP